MRKEDMEMIARIFDSERVGYAYLYPRDGGARQESMISTTPENIANYIGSHMFEAEKLDYVVGESKSDIIDSEERLIIL